MQWSRLLDTPTAPLPELDWWALACPPEPGHPYGRKLLYECPAGEVLLMQWRVGQWTAPHDHGGAGGLVRVLEGRLEERRYAVERGAVDGESRGLALGESRGALTLRGQSEARAGQSLGVGSAQIHAVRASVASLSLHVYWPLAQRGMWVHDLARRRAHQVPPGHGAWLPTEPTPTRDWSAL